MIGRQAWYASKEALYAFLVFECYFFVSHFLGV